MIYMVSLQFVTEGAYQKSIMHILISSQKKRKKEGIIIARNTFLEAPLFYVILPKS